MMLTLCALVGPNAFDSSSLLRHLDPQPRSFGATGGDSIASFTDDGFRFGINEVETTCDVASALEAHAAYGLTALGSSRPWLQVQILKLAPKLIVGRDRCEIVL